MLKCTVRVLAIIMLMIVSEKELFRRKRLLNTRWSLYQNMFTNINRTACNTRRVRFPIVFDYTMGHSSICALIHQNNPSSESLNKLVRSIFHTFHNLACQHQIRWKFHTAFNALWKQSMKAWNVPWIFLCCCFCCWESNDKNIIFWMCVDWVWFSWLWGHSLWPIGIAGHSVSLFLRAFWWYSYLYKCVCVWICFC